MALVSATLERNGYEVACIESGAEALRLLEKANTSAWSLTCAPRRR